MAEDQRAAVVTGASTGIGRAICAALIDKGWIVYGSVRKETDAAEAEAALGPSFKALIFDVTDDAAIRAGAEAVAEDLGSAKLAGLVNNAGVAVPGPIEHLSLDDLQFQLDVNLYGPIRVSQAFLPVLGADKSRTGPAGRIVNMSSVAGKIASPFMGPYSMSKHALEALSDTMRRELFVHGIDVVTVGPGAVKTPIWGKTDNSDLTQFEETVYAPMLRQMSQSMSKYGEQGIDADKVGALVHDILIRPTPKTRYAILKNKFFLWTLPRLLPPRMVDKALARRFGLKNTS